MSVQAGFSEANSKSAGSSSGMHRAGLLKHGEAARSDCVHCRSNEADDTLIQDIKTTFGQSNAPLSKSLILAAEASEAATLPPAAVVRVSTATCAVAIVNHQAGRHICKCRV